jgi:hypothetical protein
MPVHGVRARSFLLVLVASLALSGVDAVTAPGLVSAAAPSSPAVDPRDLPLLPGPAPAPQPAAAADPHADFGPLSGRAHFDAARSYPVSRSMFATEYANPDGTRTFTRSTVPVNVRDSRGAWQPVDTGLTADSGRVRANRHPLHPSLATRADDPSLVSVEVDGASASLALEQGSASAARVDGSRVGYTGVLPDTDLDYEITPGAVKETVRLTRPGASSWRFRLRTSGLTPSVTADGTVALTDGSGRAPIVLPPIEVWDSTGTADRPPAITGGRYSVEKAAEGWVLTVAVDQEWLRDPKRVYPVSVDPTFATGDDESYSYKSDGASCHNCGLGIGSPLNRGTVWRSLFDFNVQPLFGQTVIGARMDVVNQRSATTVDKTFPADLYQGVAFNFNGIGQYLAGAPVGQVGSFSDARLTADLRAAVDGPVPGPVVHAGRLGAADRVDLQEPGGDADGGHRFGAARAGAGRAGGQQRAGHADADPVGEPGVRSGR